MFTYRLNVGLRYLKTIGLIQCDQYIRLLRRDSNQSQINIDDISLNLIEFRTSLNSHGNRYLHVGTSWTMRLRFNARI